MMPDSLSSLLLLLLTTSSTFATAASPPRACEMSTVASTPLVDFLERLQETALAAFGPRDFDPKLYVDLSLRSDLEAVERAFALLPRSPNGSVPAGDLERFVAAHFEGAGADLVHAQPAGFVPAPEGFLPRVKDPAVRAWALEVHALWTNLSRRVDDAVRERPDWHTLLPLPRPVIIPGSRFREVSYWDSYWIIRLAGELASYGLLQQSKFFCLMNLQVTVSFSREISGDDDLPRGLGPPGLHKAATTTTVSRSPSKAYDIISRLDRFPMACKRCHINSRNTRCFFRKAPSCPWSHGRTQTVHLAVTAT